MNREPRGVVIGIEAYPPPAQREILPGRNIARCSGSTRAAGRHPTRKETRMAARDDQKRIGGISAGGIIVIVGILALIFWSFRIGLIVILIGLIAFGGFARGKWY